MKNIENKNELLKLITPVRLQAYGTESSDILLDRCIYNVKISETFYPALAFVELSLRNRIFHHEMIINRNQTPQEQYQLVLNILHLLSADVEKLLNGISRFQNIIIQKP